MERNQKTGLTRKLYTNPPLEERDESDTLAEEAVVMATHLAVWLHS